MARVTIENCIENVPNRFELVILAAKRARELSKGALPLVKRGNDKNAVVALREIVVSAELIEETREQTIIDQQTEIAEIDEPLEDEMNFPVQKSRIKRKFGKLELSSDIVLPTFAKNYKKKPARKKQSDGFRNQIVSRHWIQQVEDNEVDIREMMASHRHRSE